MLRNCTFIIFGVVVGLSVSFLMFTYKKPKLVTINFSQVISSYAAQKSNSNLDYSEIEKEFKAKINKTVDKFPNNYILVNKNGLISKFEAVDLTSDFISRMENL